MAFSTQTTPPRTEVDSTSWFSLPNDLVEKLKANGKVAARKLLEFDGSKWELSFDVSNWKDKKHKCSNWMSEDDAKTARVFLDELLASHPPLCALEKEYEEKLAQGMVMGEKKDTSRQIEVQHLGSGVLVQRLTVGLVDDHAGSKPSLITCRDSRDVARAAIASLFWNEEKRHSIVTGNPGIGKSCGVLMHILQQLLVAQSTVVLLAYKTNSAYLFVPTGETEWVVRMSTADKSDVKDLLQVDEVIALIDPPDVGDYVRYMGSFSITVALPSERHIYSKFTENGQLLFASMLLEDELRAITPVLWNDQKSPGPGQTFPDLKSKQDEVVRRAKIVGFTFRYIFIFEEFCDRAIKMVHGVKLLSQQKEGLLPF